MTGTGTLLRLALRRDRLLLLVWVVGLVGITLVTVSGLQELYGTLESRRQLASTAAVNPAFLALLGPLSDHTTLGGVLAWRWGVFGGLLVGLMSLFLLTRHTRAEEESGRLELLGSAVVGRHAPLAAAVVVGLLAPTLVGGLVAAGLIGLDQPVAGSVAFGLAFASPGWVFTGVSAVAAQLPEGARTANALGGAVLGGTYLLRAVGDAAGDHGPTWLTWCSPLGWAQRVEPYAHDRWWVLLLPVIATVLLVGLASVLVTRRDLGAGLIATRPGPAHTSLAGPFGLAWRLHRGTLLGWTFGMLVLGAVYGAVARGVEEMLDANPALERVIAQMGGTGSLVDVYFASIFGIIGLFSAIHAVTTVLRLRVEETSHRVEPILATTAGRWRVACAHLLYATLGTAVVLTAAGLGAGLVHGVRTGDVAAQLPRLVGAALAQAPAVWVVTGVAVLLFGVLPKATSAAWAFLVGFLVLGQLGPLLRLPGWVTDLSPFTHVPKLPSAHLDAWPLVWLTAVAGASILVGLAAFRRRDIG
ncbi:exporter of polyketide antibiotics [Saccharothrix violaceirubra]|uniref:ABC-2 type transport system permease protein n=1 Tax=Saccharothrix violaceirubra TaxID=413306 RepID=A0A7W7WVX4_9PSEU|nr:ABC transporter permease [Saccharothrix violaceirubra]MBB4964953.1 ABC-2 type transport system permease protein [Saccharothrix violaceirubra]